MIDDWLDIEKWERGDSKILFVLREKDATRLDARPDLIERVRAHYDDPRHIAEDIAELGFPGAANILRERLPTDPRTRSGEMGEILATEFVEHQTRFRIPVRRLRYKDGREMALRGDDFLGVDEVNGRINYLKGEAKSGQIMSTAVIRTARERLNDDNGRPTPISLLFITDRLLEGNEGDKVLGRQIRNAVGGGAIRASDVTHGLFTLTGNDRLDDLEADLNNAAGSHSHITVNLRIDDHQEFIGWIYLEAENLGDD